MVIEPIDFSGNDNEYLSSDLKQQVLAFSIIWSVVGFIFSAWLFLGKKVGPASLILDRRQAEGRVVDASSRRSSSSFGTGGFSSSSPRVSPYKAPERKEQKWSHLAQVGTQGEGDPTSLPAETPKETRKPVLLKAAIDAPAARTAHRTLTPMRPTRPREQLANDHPDRLLYPVVSGRPEPGHLAAVTRDVERSMVRLVNFEGAYHVGLILDGTGKILVSDSFLQDGSIDRVHWNGNVLKAQLLGRDAEYGIALLALPPGNYGPSIPLAPMPPARGEELLAFGPSPSRCLSTVVRAGVGFSHAGFLVEGYLGSGTWGTPLLNTRGELVGCNFSSLPDFPGSGVHLAADSAAIYRLLRGYQNPDPGAYDGTLTEAYSRLTSLAGETRDEDGTKRGRILARVGVSQFFIGMSRDEAGKWVSSPQRSSARDGVENWRSQAPPVELVFVNDRLVAVATDFTGFSTLTGLSMGARVDRQTLSRSFDRFLLVDGLALTPGLDIMLDREGKASQFVVRPEL